MTRTRRRIFLGGAAAFGVLVLTYIALFLVPPAQGTEVIGVHFAPAHAQYLGLDWRAAYRALLDDLGVRRLRLAAYWPEVEPHDGELNFRALDWMMDEAADRGATVVLGVGRRLPRWPECHIPEWARALPDSVQQERIERVITAAVERYRSHPALGMWQVENEPFLAVFGECPALDRASLQREVDIVRALDPGRNVLITDSGELSLWRRASRVGDRLGTTMYRVVWSPVFGYVSYAPFLPAAGYRLKAFLVGMPPERMVIAELQAEPWVQNGDIAGTPIAEHRRSMDAERLRNNVAFARATGFHEVYLWGAEYWYWLKEQGDASLWDAAREVF
ncbi:MAG: beta-galactosidase [bacterium]|nr:beta-galactosidase [bacterium]